MNVSRNLAIKIRELHRPEAEDLQSVRDIIVAFCFGLKDHLRDDVVLTKLPGFESEKATPGHVPSYIVRRLYSLFGQWKQDDKLSDEQLSARVAVGAGRRLRSVDDSYHNCCRLRRDRRRGSGSIR